MKSNFSRSLFAAFLIVAGYVGSFAQTTVTLPAIPCSNCNGPGAFATSAPACTSGLVGAPLTMSWGAASGATSYTIMIATDAALSQNVATYTQTGTSLSVPALALKPSVTYYWTVFANSATGSTKATGGVCTFSTNTTWTGTSLTGGFPNGGAGDQLLNQGIAGGFYDCRTGDGTCASGDNLLCNPQYKSISAQTFVPNWIFLTYYTSTPVSYVGGGGSGTNFTGVYLPSISGVGTPPTGTTTGAALGTTSGYVNMTAYQPLYITNTSGVAENYKVSFWAKGSIPTRTNLVLGIDDNPVGYDSDVTTPLNTSWTQYSFSTLRVDPGTKVSRFYITQTSSPDIAWITDIVLCKL